MPLAAAIKPCRYLLKRSFFVSPQPLLPVLLLIAVCTAIFFTHLGTARLWDRDEPRNAGCAAEMLQRGDWVVPTFNDELRHQKPVLLYWLIMSAFSLFGQSEFSARFWSATLATGTVLATFGIGSRLTNRKIGLLAGLILATSLMFDVAARAATPDSVLIFCGTLAIWVYVAGTNSFHTAGNFGSGIRQNSFALDDASSGIRQNSFALDDASSGIRPNSAESEDGTWFPQNGFVVLAFYVCLGLGVLAKGPVGFLLPMAMIGWFMLIQRLPDSNSTSDYRFRRVVEDLFRPFHPAHFLKTLWAMRPITGAIVVLLVAAPWYVLVHQQTDGDFTRLFFIGEHLGRATNSLEGHGYGIWFYPVTLLIGFFPWSVFWWPVAKEIVAEKRANGRLEPILVFCLCMIAIQVGVFSLAKTKLPSYVTPCYPALAMLTAVSLVRWSEGASRIASRWYLIALVSMMVGGVLISTGLGIAASHFFPDQWWLVFIGFVPVAGATVALGRLATEDCGADANTSPRRFNGSTCVGQGPRRAALISVLVSSVVFSTVLFGFGTVAVDSVNQSQIVLDPIANSDHRSMLATYRTLESSWVYYAGQPIYECLVEANLETDLEVQGRAKMQLERTGWWKPKPRLTPEAMVRLDPGIAFITTDEFVAELQQRLPSDYVIEESAEYFLKDRRLLLLRRASPK